VLSYESALSHYDPANILSNCAGWQFVAAPPVAWWSLFDRLEDAFFPHPEVLARDGGDAEGGAVIEDEAAGSVYAIGVGEAAETRWRQRQRRRPGLRRLHEGMRQLSSAVHLSMLCAMYAVTGVAFCAGVLFCVVCFSPFLLLGELLWLLVRLAFEGERDSEWSEGLRRPCLSLTEPGRRLSFTPFFAEVVLLLASTFALAMLQLLWTPLALLLLLGQVAMQVLTGRSLLEALSLSQLLPLLCSPCMHLVEIVTQYFGD
jgi:hypothetical protein